MNEQNCIIQLSDEEKQENLRKIALWHEEKHLRLENDKLKSDPIQETLPVKIKVIKQNRDIPILDIPINFPHLENLRLELLEVKDKLTPNVSEEKQEKLITLQNEKENPFNLSPSTLEGDNHQSYISIHDLVRKYLKFMHGKYDTPALFYSHIIEDIKNLKPIDKQRYNSEILSLYETLEEFMQFPNKFFTSDQIFKLSNALNLIIGWNEKSHKISKEEYTNRSSLCISNAEYFEKYGKQYLHPEQDTRRRSQDFRRDVLEKYGNNYKTQQDYEFEENMKAFTVQLQMEDSQLYWLLQEVIDQCDNKSMGSHISMVVLNYFDRIELENVLEQHSSHKFIHDLISECFIKHGWMMRSTGNINKSDDTLGKFKTEPNRESLVNHLRNIAIDYFI